MYHQRVRPLRGRRFWPALGSGVDCPQAQQRRGCCERRSGAAARLRGASHAAPVRLDSMQQASGRVSGPGRRRGWTEAEPPAGSVARPPSSAQRAP
uniref:Uncharacterized protein n=1 Tax=Tetraselmis sp. GSL018 TaxID=582737 RepID=A0A061QM68_9CHLO